jgi:hypothetical protein
VKQQPVGFAFFVAHLWAMMTFLGGIGAVTFVIHPNVFHDVPRSLETTMSFAVARGPSDFLGPVGLVAILTGFVAVILGWRVRAARYGILGGVVLLILGEIVFSILFFWPRNTILFVEGTRVHPVGVLERAAWEFRAGHWLRLALAAIAAACSFLGFLDFHRHRISSRVATALGSVAAD